MTDMLITLSARVAELEQDRAADHERADSAVDRAQQTAYLDAVHRHFSERGIVLTDPGELLRSEPVKTENARAA